MTFETGARDLEGFDAVVHLAALSNDPLGDLDPPVTYAINLDATVCRWHARRKDAGVRRFVFASSCSIYGASRGRSARRGRGAPSADAPTRSRRCAPRRALRGAGRTTTFVDGPMRNATAYGVSPRLRFDVVLNNLVAWAHTTGSIRMQSDGTSWRPLVHIDDISRATARLLAAKPARAVAGEAFNIGSARPRTTGSAISPRSCKACCRNARSPSPATASPDPRSYRVDFSKFAHRFPGVRVRVGG